MLRVRYMPYSWKELSRLHFINSSRPNFDRNGQQIKGLKYFLSLIFGLGSKNSKGALFRWAVLVIAAAFLEFKKGALSQLLTR